MDKVTMNENTYVDLTIKVPADYQLNLYNSLVQQQVEQEAEPSVENGVEFITYRWHKTDYEFRMVNQSLSIVVSAPDPTMNMDVMLLGNAMAVFKPKTGNGTDLEPQYVYESGPVQLNGKAQQLELIVGINGQVSDELTNNQLVVKADGQDLSSLFSTTPEWHGNNQGFITTTPISGELLKAKNWIIGLKDINSNIVTHRATITGEIADNVVTIQWRSAQGVLNDYQVDANTPTVTSTSDESPIACRLCVTLADGYTFKAYFNGQQLTGFTKEGSVWSATFSEPATTDGSWVFEFAKKPAEIIQFADANVKAICVANWDTDHDGELSKDEAAAVTTLKVGNSPVFFQNTSITSFDELQYFTGLTTLEGGAFRGCTSLTSVVIPDGVTAIQNAVFQETAIVRMMIPNSVVSMGESVFLNANSLVSVKLSNNITAIGKYTFQGCTKLEEVYIPQGLTIIDKQAFYGCSSLKTIALPASLQTIGENAFASTRNIKSLFIPENVETIGEGAFSDGSYYENFTVSRNNRYFDSRNGCGAIIEKSTNKLLWASKSTEVIPEGVTAIGKAYGSAKSLIKNVVIPASVTSIDDSAFSRCTQLTSVVSKSDTPPTIGSSTFTYISSTCVLWVPYGKTQAYASWASYFKEIKELPSKYDVNEDGTVSISDVTKLVNVILGKDN